MPSWDDVELSASHEDGQGEDLEFEVAFYEELLKKLPNSIDILMALGNDYVRRGSFDRGLWVDQRLCELRAQDPIVHYNLACSYSLLGRVDEALAALEKAIRLGYRDYAYMQKDPDLKSLRTDPRYRRLLESVLPQELTS